ncbi:MAG: aldose epimerase family protein [Nakamurella sp.]
MHSAELSSDTLSVTIIDHGARIASVRTPDRNGVAGEVALGFDDEQGWLEDGAFLGATIGRIANRVDGARFTVDGTEHRITPNEGGHALHGGPQGFDKQTFVLSVVESAEDGAQSLSATRRSPDGEMGFPGNLDVTVTYTVVGSALTIGMSAVTDAPTPVALTNHTYWNLRGAPGSIEDHVFRIEADSVLPVRDDLIPTGEIDQVADTPFDLRESVRIGAQLHTRSAQTLVTRGIDHDYLLQDRTDRLSTPVARVAEPVSGRTMTMYTDQDGLQVYTGNFLDGSKPLRSGTTARQGGAFCLEPQAHPNAVNSGTDDASRGILRPGDSYRWWMRIEFGVEG